MMPDDFPIIRPAETSRPEAPSTWHSIGEMAAKAAAEMVQSRGKTAKSFTNSVSCAKNEAATECAGNTPDGLNTAANEEPRMSLNHHDTGRVKSQSGTLRHSECDEIAAAAYGRALHPDEVWPFVFEHMLARGGLGRRKAISGADRGWMIAEYDTALRRVIDPELRGALAMGFADSIRRNAGSDFPMWMIVDCLTKCHGMTFTPSNVYRLAEDFAIVGAAVRSVEADK